MLEYGARNPTGGTFAQVGDKTKAYFGLGVHVSLDRAEGVFNLSEAGKFFGRTILSSLKESERSGRVLDVGTGSGVLAIIAKTFGCVDVTATDIDETIISLARRNAEANLKRYQWLTDRDARWRPEIHFAVSDLFSNRVLFSDELAKWDLVLFNPPGWPTPSDPALRQRLFECLGREYYSRFEGDQVILRFLQWAPQYLRAGGRILISVNSMVGVDAIISRLHAPMQNRGACRLNFRSLAQRDLDWDWTKDQWRVHPPVIEQLGRWHQDPGSCFVFSEGKIRFAFDIIEATVEESPINA